MIVRIDAVKFRGNNPASGFQVVHEGEVAALYDDKFARIGDERLEQLNWTFQREIIRELEVDAAMGHDVDAKLRSVIGAALHSVRDSTKAITAASPVRVDDETKAATDVTKTAPAETKTAPAEMKPAEPKAENPPSQAPAAPAQPQPQPQPKPRR